MSNFYNEEYEDVRQWSALIEHEYFQKLIDKLNTDMQVLQKDIDKLISDPTFDGAIKAAALGKAKQQLDSLLRYFNFMKEKKSHLDKRNVERKIVLPYTK